MSSIADFSLHAAKRYLRSAVFIDDNIFNQATAVPDEVNDVVVRQPKAVFDEGDPIPTNPAPPSEETSPRDIPFRTKDLVSSFAEQGIACALYEPEKGFSTDENSTVFKLCETVDLVVLDWDFHEFGVRGEKPKALIEKLVNTGNNVAPHHVRLIAIYTNTPSLGFIANAIFRHLDKKQIPIFPVETCSFRLQAGASRILVLGKAGGVTRVENEISFTVKEEMLSQFLVEEFAKMNEGILSSCALLGMANVRQSSRRVLDKFQSDLDAQFLFHRALIRSSEEAFDQLPDLLGDEFRAVIEDSIYHPQNLKQFVEDCSDSVRLSSPPKKWNFRKDTLIQDVLREFFKDDNGLEKRLSGRTAAHQDEDPPKNLYKYLASICGGEDGLAHERFSALLSNRTQYQSAQRILGCGAVVQDLESQKFSICIMPSCDALRLKVATMFPFWQLSTSSKGTPVILQKHDGKLLSLVFERVKPSRRMWMTEFLPDTSLGLVVATPDENGRYIFTSGEKRYEWIAQLKPSHSQRICNTVGDQLARVGLTEAEWSRCHFQSGEEQDA